MQTITVARHAMATRFEVLLHGPDAVALRAAAEEALDEIERLETQLSLFRPASEISRVNRYAAGEPVRVTPPVFGLLQRAKQLSAETGGAFDITVAPLMRCWGFQGGSGALPEPAALAAARTCVGMDLVELNPGDCTVRFQRDGVMLDLGAIGKGYALDCAIEVLRETGVTSGFIHGGTSSSYALGAPPDAAYWKAALPHPALPRDLAPLAGAEGVLATVALAEESLGVSGVHGKAFTAAGRTYGHVLDPRTGEPAQQVIMAAVVLPSATEADALSTALLTLGEEGLERVSRLRPNLRALLVAPDPGPRGFRVLTHPPPSAVDAAPVSGRSGFQLHMGPAERSGNAHAGATSGPAG